MTPEEYGSLVAVELKQHQLVFFDELVALVREGCREHCNPHSEANGAGQPAAFGARAVVIASKPTLPVFVVEGAGLLHCPYPAAGFFVQCEGPAVKSHPVSGHREVRQGAIVRQAYDELRSTNTSDWQFCAQVARHAQPLSVFGRCCQDFAGVGRWPAAIRRAHREYLGTRPKLRPNGGGAQLGLSVSSCCSQMFYNKQIERIPGSGVGVGGFGFVWLKLSFFLCRLVLF